MDELSNSHIVKEIDTSYESQDDESNEDNSESSFDCVDDTDLQININHNRRLGVEQRVNVLEAYDRKLSFAEISSMFNCSSKQIRNIVRNRKSILTAYIQTDSDPHVSENCARSRNAESNSIEIIRKRNKLNLRKRVEVIKMYKRDKHLRSQLPALFDCSDQQIRRILKNYKAILKEYNTKEYKTTRLKHNIYGLAEQLQSHSHLNLSCLELSKAFNCSKNQIKFILQNSDKILNNFGQNTKSRRSFRKGDTLIRTVDSTSCSNRLNVTHAYDGSISKNILTTKPKDQQLKRSVFRQSQITMKKSKDFSNDHTSLINSDAVPFENLQISSYKEAFIALKPLEDYADLSENTTAKNLLTQLDEYLHDVITRQQQSTAESVVESSTLVSKIPQLCSYQSILNALKPVENYVKLKNNVNCINLMSQLEEHLKTKLNKVDHN